MPENFIKDYRQVSEGVMSAMLVQWLLRAWLTLQWRYALGSVQK